MKIKNLIKSVAIPLSFALALGTAEVKKAEAGPGARAIGMGGAHVSVADDSTSTYWNPAGLVGVKEQVNISVDPTFNYNYSGFAGYAKPLKNQDGVAVSVIGRGEPRDKQVWLSGAYGKKINKNLDVGVSLHLKARKYDNETEKFGVNFRTDDFTSVDADIGAKYKIGKLTFGLLLQDLVKVNAKGPNVRPGVSYSDGKTTIAVDYYDVFNRYGKYDKENKPNQGICAGIEHKLNDNLELRAGYYKNTPTFGAGVNLGKGWKADYAHVKKWNGNLVGITKKF